MSMNKNGRMTLYFLKVSLLTLLTIGLASCSKSPSLLMSSAMSNGRIEEVKQLLASDAFAKNPKKLNNFFKSCPPNIDLLKLFIDAGAEINYIDNVFGSILTRFANEDTKVLQFLIDSGADINDIRSGSAAIFRIKHEKNLKFFIKNGANLSVQDKKGNTPLHKAVEKNRLDILKILLDANANTTIRNKRKRLASDLALKVYKNYEIVAYFKKKGVIKPRSMKNLKHQIPIAFQDESQYSLDGKLFAIAAQDIILFDAKSRKQLSVFSQKGKAVAIEFSADSQNLIVLYEMNSGAVDAPFYEVVDIELSSLKELKRFRLPVKTVMEYPEIKISPDKKLVATNFGSKIAIFDWKGKLTWEWQVNEKENVNRQRGRFDVTADWKYFLINLQRVEYPSKKTLPAVKFSDKKEPFIHSAKISADGKSAVAAGHANGEIFRLFNLVDGKLIKENKVGGTELVLGNGDLSVIVGEHGIWYPSQNRIDPINPISNFDGLNLAYSEVNQEVSAVSIFFSLATAKNWKSVDSNKGDGLWMKFAAHGILDIYDFDDDFDKIRVGGLGYKVTLKEVYKTKHKSRYSNPESLDGSFTVNPLTKKVIFKSGEELLILPENSQKEIIRTANISRNNIINCTITNNFKDAAALYDVSTKKHKLIILPEVKESFNHGTYISTQGNFLEVSTSAGNYIYDIKNKKVVLDNLKKCSTQFTLDEKYFIVSKQKLIYFYNTKTWLVDKTFTISSGGVVSMRISPDNKKLLITNTNSQGQLFDLESGALIYTLVKAGYYDIVVFDKSGNEVFSTAEISELFKSP